MFRSFNHHQGAVNVFNNVILARNRQLPDDDRMIEACRSIFKSFNVNNLSVCIGWCANQKLNRFCIDIFQKNNDCEEGVVLNLGK